jgi:hypothetical protein
MYNAAVPKLPWTKRDLQTRRGLKACESWLELAGSELRQRLVYQAARQLRIQGMHFFAFVHAEIAHWEFEL